MNTTTSPGVAALRNALATQQLALRDAETDHQTLTTEWDISSARVAELRETVAQLEASLALIEQRFEPPTEASILRALADDEAGIDPEPEGAA